MRICCSFSIFCVSNLTLLAIIFSNSGSSLSTDLKKLPNIFFLVIKPIILISFVHLSKFESIFFVANPAILWSMNSFSIAALILKDVFVLLFNNLEEAAFVLLFISSPISSNCILDGFGTLT